MISKAIWSVVVGGGISALLFVPFLVWQFRRFGAPSGKRMLWNVVGVVYATAVVAYTLFPLPDMAGGYCDKPRNLTVWDPTVPFRELAAQGGGLMVMATSWTLWQMLFNVALFVPLGVLLRRFLRWSPVAAMAGGLAASALIEATQFTANWGLVQCRYRVTDTNDLLTNTVGGALGVAVAALLPRFEASPDYLRARRHLARPVTRSRRWTGMFLDLVYFGVTAVFVYTLTIGALFVIAREAWQYPTNEQWQWLVFISMLMVVAAGLVMLLVPTLTGGGASLGQRTVYLQPVTRTDGASPSRGRRLARAFVVHGLGLVSLAAGPAVLLAPVTLWVMVAIGWVAFDVHGASAKLTALRFVDSRTLVEPPARAATATAVVVGAGGSASG